ncbi:hypothetical protein F4780DRAFT_742071 [Xylariomycetidae sp. FL0641]|nr:hypothetical protein F4780DRAFT_742071 [Xylariomycetidae sp. FL0641]
MGIRDLIKKKDGLGEGDGAYSETLNRLNAGPEFTFIRSDTRTQEIIRPPSFANDNDQYLNAHAAPPSRTRRSLDVFRPRSRGNSSSSVASAKEKEKDYLAVGDSNGGGGKRPLSQRLFSSRNNSSKRGVSEYVPADLPQINVTPDAPASGPGGDGAPEEQKAAAEGLWERRATILASAHEEQIRRSRSPGSASASPSPAQSPRLELTGLTLHDEGESQPHTVDGVVSSKQIDDDIQQAIRLHEDGDLEQSTRLFGRLADPAGANNPLSQVLYGLALRHGWGCEPDPERAVTYLSAAAANAAQVETRALKAGLQKGGAAKGELVLAIFELANCFRHAWGTPRDPVAAKQYYETAANLGDTDAMNEVAWCYLEGFGCKKDKYASARYYRLAEQNGSKTLGNTWIWKDKYNPTSAKGKK